MVSVWLVGFVAGLLFLSLLFVLLVIVNFSQKYTQLFQLCQYSDDKYHDLSNSEVSMQARVEQSIAVEYPNYCTDRPQVHRIVLQSALPYLGLPSDPCLASCNNILKQPLEMGRLYFLTSLTFVATSTLLQIIINPARITACPFIVYTSLHASLFHVPGDPQAERTQPWEPLTLSVRSRKNTLYFRLNPYSNNFSIIFTFSPLSILQVPYLISIFCLT